ncbi:bifunctional diguanylate cyclase/phosphodiesterase [Thiomicrorhabdus cannonii]|uniref:bifunctional diguanylate cyclase/phosphodiesterase n=1 Tax=Thiomicrorhabdus cannonii TaxID=2748011 RepID=UPI0015BBD7D7|nr:EAL domain-containing protein [Thiomicrorhabdus cannonii]
MWLILIAALGAVYFFQVELYRSAAVVSLQQNVGFKVGQIEAWIEERFKDAATLSHHQEFIDAVRQLSDGATKEKIASRLQAFTEAASYEKITLVNARNRILLEAGSRSTDVDIKHLHELLHSLAETPDANKFTVFFNETSFHVDVVVPLFDPRQANRLVGKLVFHINPQGFLIPFIRDWPAANSSEENALFVFKDGQLQPLVPRERQGELAAASMKMTDSTWVYPRFLNALQRGENKGVLWGADHNGKPSLMVFQRIPQSDWVLVAKMDKAEVLAPLHRFIGVFALAGLLVMLAFGYALRRGLENRRLHIEDTLLKARAKDDHRALKRTRSLLDLTMASPQMQESELLESAMNKIEALTDSKIGFVHFVSKDQNEIEIVTWSSNTLEHYCTANYDSHYPVDKAGIWADCVRTGKPVVVNDYATADNKKGLPEGHSDLQRFVSVPILYDGLVRMIVGVGNAAREYDVYDVESIELFGSELYRIVLLKRLYTELEESEQRFHLLFSKAPVAYQSLDEQGQILDVNDAWLLLMGLQEGSAETVIGRNIREFIDDAWCVEFDETFKHFLQTGRLRQHIMQIRRPDGGVLSIEITGRILVDDKGRLRTHCMLVDVTQRLQQERSLRLAGSVFENAGEGIMITDAQRRILSVNRAFTRILGYSAEEAVGQTPALLHSGKHDAEFYQRLHTALHNKGEWKGEIWNRTRSGEVIPEWLSISALKNEKGEVENYIGVFSDISSLKASEERVAYMAFHDDLTSLPNRRSFKEKLEASIKQAKRDTKKLAVIMIGLNRFKDINDSYGHEMGDEVLCYVASLLLKQVRTTDRVARFGDDVFALLLEGIHHEDDAGRIAANLIGTIGQAMRLSNQQVVNIMCSVGIGLYPNHSVLAEELIQCADTAMHISRRLRSNGYEYFSAEMTERVQMRLLIETELKAALQNGELRVFYQPQISLVDRTMKGAEALVRWQHPRLGLVSPAYFIGVAEETGLIAEVGEWVLKETCRQVKEWLEKGYEKLIFAVNVSPKQMVYNDLFDSVMRALSESGMSPECLEIEITESALMTVSEHATSQFEQLRGLGVRIAIDDFGTGYSSLAYLKNLPLDVLKIDKQFVDDIPHNEAGMQIVNTIIAMAHQLQLKVLAEGVETEVQRDFLALRGCDFYQGYLMSPPVSAEDFERLFLKPAGKSAKPPRHAKPH